MPDYFPMLRESTWRKIDLASRRRVNLWKFYAMAIMEFCRKSLTIKSCKRPS